MTVATPTSAFEQVRALAAELLSHDRWSRDQVLAYQRARLQDILRHAFERSPYYREAFGADAPDRPLESLPTLPKSVLVEEFDRIVTDKRLRRVDLEAFLEEADAGAAFLGEYRVFSTSGTSGIPGLFVFAHDELAHWIGVALAAFARVGVGPETRFVAIGAPSALHITRQQFAAHAGRATRRSPADDADADAGARGHAQPLRARGGARLRERRGCARRRAARRAPGDHAADRDLYVRGAHRGRSRSDRGGVGDPSGQRVRSDRGGADGDGLDRRGRDACLGGLRRPRGRRRGGPCQCHLGSRARRCC